MYHFTSHSLESAISPLASLLCVGALVCLSVITRPPLQDLKLKEATISSVEAHSSQGER